MFKELNLKATYSSYEDDIATEFYIPTLKTSKKYDRATAYFSAKALASYAKGMETFGRLTIYRFMSFIAKCNYLGCDI